MRNVKAFKRASRFVLQIFPIAAFLAYTFYPSAPLSAATSALSCDRFTATLFDGIQHSPERQYVDEGVKKLHEKSLQTLAEIRAANDLDDPTQTGAAFREHIIIGGGSNAWGHVNSVKARGKEYDPLVITDDLGLFARYGDNSPSWGVDTSGGNLIPNAMIQSKRFNVQNQANPMMGVVQSATSAQALANKTPVVLGQRVVAIEETTGKWAEKARYKVTMEEVAADGSKIPTTVYTNDITLSRGRGDFAFAKNENDSKMAALAKSEMDLHRTSIEETGQVYTPRLINQAEVGEVAANHAGSGENFVSALVRAKREETGNSKAKAKIVIFAPTPTSGWNAVEAAAGFHTHKGYFPPGSPHPRGDVEIIWVGTQIKEAPNTPEGRRAMADQWAEKYFWTSSSDPKEQGRPQALMAAVEEGLFRFGDVPEGMRFSHYEMNAKGGVDVHFKSKTNKDAPLHTIHTDAFIWGTGQTGNRDDLIKLGGAAEGAKFENVLSPDGRVVGQVLPGHNIRKIGEDAGLNPDMLGMPQKRGVATTDPYSGRIGTLASYIDAYAALIAKDLPDAKGLLRLEAGAPGGISAVTGAIPLSATPRAIVPGGSELLSVQVHLTQHLQRMRIETISKLSMELASDGRMAFTGISEKSAEKIARTFSEDKELMQALKGYFDNNRDLLAIDLPVAQGRPDLVAAKISPRDSGILAGAALGKAIDDPAASGRASATRVGIPPKEMDVVMDLDGLLLHSLGPLENPAKGFRLVEAAGERYQVAESSLRALESLLDSERSRGVKVNLSVFSGGGAERNIAAVKGIMLKTPDGTNKRLYDLLKQGPDGNPMVLSRADVSVVREHFEKNAALKKRFGDASKAAEAKDPELPGFRGASLIKDLDGRFDLSRTVLLDDNMLFSGKQPGNLIRAQAIKGRPEVTARDWKKRIPDLLDTALRSVSEDQDVRKGLLRRQFRIVRNEDDELALVFDAERAFAANRNTLGRESKALARAAEKPDLGTSLAVKALAEQNGVWRKGADGDQAALDLFNKRLRASGQAEISLNELRANLYESFLLERLQTTGDALTDRSKQLFEDLGKLSSDLYASTDPAALSAGIRAVQESLAGAGATGRVLETTPEQALKAKQAFAKAYADEAKRFGSSDSKETLIARANKIADICNAGGMCHAPLRRETVAVGEGVEAINAIRASSTQIAALPSARSADAVASSQPPTKAEIERANRILQAHAPRVWALDPSNPSGTKMVDSLSPEKSKELENLARERMMARTRLSNALIDYRNSLSSGGSSQEGKILEASKSYAESTKRHFDAMGFTKTEVKEVPAMMENGAQVPRRFVLETTGKDSLLPGRSFNALIRQTEGVVRVVEDPARTDIAQTGGGYMRKYDSLRRYDGGELVLPSFEAYPSRIVNSTTQLHEIDHAIRDFRSASPVYRAKLADRIVKASPDLEYGRAVSEAKTIKPELLASYTAKTGLPDSEARIKLNQHAKAFERELEKRISLADREQIAVSTARGEMLDPLYAPHFQAEELHNYGGDAARLQSLHDQATYVARVLGPDQVPAALRPYLAGSQNPKSLANGTSPVVNSADRAMAIDMAHATRESYAFAADELREIGNRFAKGEISISAGNLDDGRQYWALSGTTDQAVKLYVIRSAKVDDGNYLAQMAGSRAGLSEDWLQVPFRASLDPGSAGPQTLAAITEAVERAQARLNVRTSVLNSYVAPDDLRLLRSSGGTGAEAGFARASSTRVADDAPSFVRAPAGSRSSGSSAAEIAEAQRLARIYSRSSNPVLADPVRAAALRSELLELRAVEEEYFKLIKGEKGLPVLRQIQAIKVHGELMQRARSLFGGLGYGVEEVLLGKSFGSLGARRALKILSVPPGEGVLAKSLANDAETSARFGRGKPLTFYYDPAAPKMNGGYFTEENAIVRKRLRPESLQGRDSILLHELKHAEIARFSQLKASAIGELAEGTKGSLPPSLARLKRRAHFETYQAVAEFGTDRMADGRKFTYGTRVDFDELATMQKQIKLLEAQARDAAFIRRHLGEDALPPALRFLPDAEYLAAHKRLYQEFAERTGEALELAAKGLDSDQFRASDFVLRREENGTLVAEIRLWRHKGNSLKSSDGLLHIPLHESKGPKDPENLNLAREYLERSRALIASHQRDAEMLASRTGLERTVVTQSTPEGDQVLVGLGRASSTRVAETKPAVISRDAEQFTEEQVRNAPAALRAAVLHRDKVERDLSDLRRQVLNGELSLHQFEERAKSYRQLDASVAAKVENVSHADLLADEEKLLARRLALANTELEAARKAKDSDAISRRGLQAAQLRAEHAAVSARWIGENLARTREIQASPAAAAEARRRTVLGFNEGFFAPFRKFFGGRSFQEVANNSAEAERLRLLAGKELVASRSAPLEARASLERAVGARFAEATPVQVRKLSDDLAEAVATGALQKNPKDRGRAMADALKAKGWTHEQMRECGNLCLPGLPVTQARARAIEPSALAREILLQDELIRAHGPGVEQARRVASPRPMLENQAERKPYEVLRSSLEEKQAALKKEEEILARRLDMAVRGREGRPDGSAPAATVEKLSQAHSEVKRARELLDARVSVVKQESQVIQAARALSPEELRLNDTAMAATVDYLRQADLADLREISPGVEAAARRLRSGELNSYEAVKETRNATAGIDPGPSAAFTKRVQDFADSKPEYAALRGGSAHEGQVAEAFRRTYRLEASTGHSDAEVTRAVYRDAGLPPGTQAIADAVGAAGEASAKGSRELKLDQVALTGKAEKELQKIAKADLAPAKAAGDSKRQLASVKSPQENFEEALKGLDEATRKSVLESAQVVERGSDEVRLMALAQKFVAASPDQRETMREVYKNMSEIMAKGEKRDSALRLGVRKMLKDLGFSPSEINGSPAPGLFKRTIACFDI